MLVVRVYARGDDRRELELDGTTLLIRRRVGDHAIADDARSFGSVSRAKWELDRECGRLVAAGFARLAGDDPAAPSEDELVAAIRAAPDDLDTYVVYADWLAERGDPWGELIAVQHALATLPRGRRERRDELDRVEARLLFETSARLWGTLGETIVNEATQTYACDLIDATWQCGFLRAIALREVGDHLASLLAGVADLDIAIPLRAITLARATWHGDDLDALTRHTWPLLDQIELVTTDWNDDIAESSPEIDALCVAIARGTFAPRLRALHLDRFHLLGPGADALAAAGFEHLRSPTVRSVEYRRG